MSGSDISDTNLIIAIVLPVVGILVFLIGWYLVSSSSKKGFTPGRTRLVYSDAYSGTYANSVQPHHGHNFI